MRPCLSALASVLALGCQAREDDHCCWTDLSIGARHACGLRPDGTIRCWGEEGSAGGEVHEAESGRFVSLTGDSATGTCAVTSEAALECWGDAEFWAQAEGLPREGVSTASVLGNGYRQLTACFDGPDVPPTAWSHQYVVEGLDCGPHPADGCPPTGATVGEITRIACWRGYQHPWVQGLAEMGDGRWWMLNVDSLLYENDYTMRMYPALVDGRSTTPGLGGDCHSWDAITESLNATEVMDVAVDYGLDDRAWVSSLVADGEPTWSVLAGTDSADNAFGFICDAPSQYPFRHNAGYVDVAAGTEQVCFLHQSGDIDCWNRASFSRRWEHYEDREMVRLFGGGKVFCGMDRDGGLECFGDDEWGQLAVPSAE